MLLSKVERDILECGRSINKVGLAGIVMDLDESAIQESYWFGTTSVSALFFGDSNTRISPTISSKASSKDRADVGFLHDFPGPEAFDHKSVHNSGL